VHTRAIIERKSLMTMPIAESNYQVEFGECSPERRPRRFDSVPGHHSNRL